MKRSPLEKLLEKQLNEEAAPRWVPEYEFAKPLRKWRFDFAWPPQKLYVEIQGGTWKGGRHTRGMGYEGDTEKANFATMAGWKGMKFTSKMVRDGRAAKETIDFLAKYYRPKKVVK